MRSRSQAETQEVARRVVPVLCVGMSTEPLPVTGARILCIPSSQLPSAAKADQFRLVVLGDAAVRDLVPSAVAQQLRGTRCKAILCLDHVPPVLIATWVAAGFHQVVEGRELDATILRSVRAVACGGVGRIRLEPQDWLPQAEGCTDEVLQALRVIDELPSVHDVTAWAARLGRSPQALSRLLRRSGLPCPKQILLRYVVAQVCGGRAEGATLTALARELNYADAASLCHAIKRLARWGGDGAERMAPVPPLLDEPNSSTEGATIREGADGYGSAPRDTSGESEPLPATSAHGDIAWPLRSGNSEPPQWNGGRSSAGSLALRGRLALLVILIGASGLLAPRARASTEARFVGFALEPAPPPPGALGEPPEAVAQHAVDAVLERPADPGALRDPAWSLRELAPATLPGTSLATALSSVSAPAGVGEAWRLARELQAQPGMMHAEPIFEVTWPDPEAEAARALGTWCEPVGAAAEADPEWNLGSHGANVLAAWAILDAAQPGARPGAGVVIGHPDTGYRKHGEIWGRGADQQPLSILPGTNFVEGQDPPLDPLGDGSPGHGTKTSSVMVSPRGKQVTDPSSEGVSGVAPGARLVPLRVIKSVMNFDAARLIAAIDLASSPGPDGLPRCAVVSMSLGRGLPSRQLHRALERAEERGVIVLAAAGNVVPWVVFPARYREVVAVGAVGATGRPWAKSSSGRQVAVSAPGQWVRVAAPRMTDSEGITEPGCGTSYAVANVAGAAALWLQKNALVLAGLPQRSDVPRAFRLALTTKGHRRPPGWPDGYGAGIVDAAALLRSAPKAKGAIKSVDLGCPANIAVEEELLASLTGERNGRRASQELASLLSVPADALCGELRLLGDELLFQIELNEDVMREVVRRDDTGRQLPLDRPEIRSLLLRKDLSADLRKALLRGGQ